MDKPANNTNYKLDNMQFGVNGAKMAGFLPAQNIYQHNIFFNIRISGTFRIKATAHTLFGGFTS